MSWVDVSPTRRAVVFAEYFPPYMSSDRRLFHLLQGVRSWDLRVLATPPLRVITQRCEDGLKPYARRFHGKPQTVKHEHIEGTYLVLPEFVHALYRHSAFIPLAYVVSIAILTTKAIAHIRRFGPDIVVVGHPSFVTGLVGTIAAKFCRLPILLDYPDAWTPLAAETSGVQSGPMLSILHGIEGFVARSASKITSITQALIDEIRDRYKVRCPATVVPNGAELKVFRPRPEVPHDRVEILYAGRLEAWAGVNEMVHIIADVVGKLGESVEFVFVGDGGAASSFRAELQARDILKYCRFEGFQPYELMPEFIARCDFAILPFPDTPTTRVSLPLKILEYMAMEKATIATRLPGLMEVVTDEAILVASLSDPALVDAVVRLAHDPSERRRLGLAGRKLVEDRFSWERITRTFEGEMNEMHDRRVTTHAIVASATNGN